MVPRLECSKADLTLDHFRVRLLTCQRIFPESASLRFIQLTRNPLRMSSERDGILTEELTEDLHEDLWPPGKARYKCGGAVSG